MPFSSKSGKAWTERLIKRLIRLCGQNNILDVGAGIGNYIRLLKPSLPQTHFTAIEIWEPYITEFKLTEKYDVVLQEDIRDFITDKRYGIAILGDVLEHLEKEEALAVYRKMLACSEFVVISIPIVYYPQDAYMGNPHERHIKDDWSHEEVCSTFPHIALHHIEQEIGVYVGYNPQLHAATDVHHANAPTVAIYGIYKDEEPFIERFLQSALPADQIVLCDTGSTDHTNKLIQKFKDMNPEIKLHTYSIWVSPWRFDDARNTALAFVNENIDLCISMDIDEYLQENWKQELVKQWEFGFTRYYHKFRTIWSTSNHSVHWHERIHSRSGYTWKLPVHEMLEYQGEERAKYLPSLWMNQEPDRTKPRASYLPLLEESVQERKQVWKSWCFLALEYLNASRYDDAHQAVDTALKLKDCDQAYLHKVKHSIYKSECKSDLALLSLDAYIAHMRNRREPYFEKALYLSELKRHAEAYFTLKEAGSYSESIVDYHYNAAAWGGSFETWRTTLRELAREEEVAN